MPARGTEGQHAEGAEEGPEGAVGEVVREAHEVRAADHREDAGPGEGVPGDSPRDRPGALDRGQRGGEVPIRDLAVGALWRVRAGGGDAGDRVPAPGVVAEVLHRLQPPQGLRRGLSPEQIAATRPDLGLSASTIYRWVAAGYAEMANMDLRRKVGYKPRRRSALRSAARHSACRSYEEFMRLPEDERASAWEMDAVEGSAADSARLLTLYHRPTSFQLVVPVADGTCAAVFVGLGFVREAPGVLTHAHRQRLGVR